VTRTYKRIGAFAVPAVIAVAAVASILLTRAGREARTPTNQPTTVPPTVGPEGTSGPFLLDLQTGAKTPLAENLAGGYSYAASPDGTRVAFSSSSGGGCADSDGITVANIDGSDARTFKSPTGLAYCAARWSPDGTKLVYQERNGADEDSVGNLFVLDLASGQRTKCTHLELTHAWWWFLFPRFGRDGGNVTFHLPRSSSQVTKWDAWSVPVTGGEPTLVLRNASFPMENPDPPGPDLFAIQFLLPSGSDLGGQSIMTGHPEVTVRETLVEANGSIWWPTISPDGTRIAYQDGGSIYVVDVSTGESSKVTEGNTAEWLDTHTLIVAP
jgi:dipeptidyl aminopeptidase/acylaminoacyl peptidase